MADKTIQGTGGSVTVANGQRMGKIDLFAANIVHGSVETTGFGDRGVRVFEATLMHVAGSISGTLSYQAGTNPVDPTNSHVAGWFENAENAWVTITLTARNGNFVGPFRALINNVAINRGEDGKGTFSADFISQQGPIPYTWN